MTINEQNRRYLIVSDLDGTLLNNKGELDQLTIDVVKKLIDNGHVFCILTGRPIETSLSIYRQLELKHLLSNHNGSCIWHPCNPTFKTINFCFSFDVIISLFTNKKVLNAFKKTLKNLVLLNNNGTYMLNLPKTKSEKEWYLKKLHVIDDEHLFKINDDFSNIKSTDVRILFLMLNDASKIDEIMYYLHLYSNTLTVRLWRERTNGIVIEINSQFACKGKSLEFLSSYYGITLDRCLSFGDGDNDVEMLTSSCHSYAMKNASEAPKVYARYITEYDNDNCGVAKELIKFFKLRGFANKRKKNG